MSTKESSENKSRIAIIVAVLALIGAALTAYFSYKGATDSVKLSIEATQTAEAKMTLADSSATPSSAPPAITALTDTPRPIPTPPATIDTAPTVYDNFDNPAFDGEWNTGLWTDKTSFPGTTSIEQKNGMLIISRQSPESGILRSLRPGKMGVDKLGFVEAKVMLDSNFKASTGSAGIGIDTFSTPGWYCFCRIGGLQRNIEAEVTCKTDENGSLYGRYLTSGFRVQYNTWHTLRFEINPDTAAISFFFDGQQIGSYTPADPETFKEDTFSLLLNVHSGDGGLVTGYFDDVRVGQFGQ